MGRPSSPLLFLHRNTGGLLPRPGELLELRRRRRRRVVLGRNCVHLIAQVLSMRLITHRPRTPSIPLDNVHAHAIDYSKASWTNQKVRIVLVQLTFHESATETATCCDILPIKRAHLISSLSHVATYPTRFEVRRWSEHW